MYLPYFGLPASAWEAVRNDKGYVGKSPEVNLPKWKVLAMPGNHDWYDGLTGFMFHACSAEILPDVTFSKLGMSPRARLAQALWRHPRRPDQERIHPLRAQAAAKEERLYCCSGLAGGVGVALSNLSAWSMRLR